MSKLLKLIKNTSRRSQIDNIQDAIITAINLDGTYNIKLPSGAIKRKAISVADGVTFVVGDVVNISMASGSKETAKIVGKGKSRSTTQTIAYV